MKNTTREWCDCCHNYSPISFWVPDEIWNEVSMGKFQHLCIMCFAKRADERLLEWDKNIVFYPFSLASDLKPQEMEEVYPSNDESRDKITALIKKQWSKNWADGVHSAAKSASSLSPNPDSYIAGFLSGVVWRETSAKEELTRLRELLERVSTYVTAKKLFTEIDNALNHKP